MGWHMWGDSWFEEHGDDLYTAIRWIMNKWKKWGRIGSHGKEKWGSFRAHPYPYVGYSPLFELFYPGYVSYYRMQQWIFSSQIIWLDKYVLRYVFRWLGLSKLICRYQRYVFNAVIQTAVKKWPEIEDELLSDLELYEWLSPGIWGKLDAKIKYKYWREL